MIRMIVVGQSKINNGQEKRPPTKKEMDAMMQEMKKQMDKLSPADKRKADSLGFKVSDKNDLQKSVSDIPEEQTKKSWENEKRIIPVKDLVRIKSIPATPATNALPAFIASIQKAVTRKIGTIEEKEAEKLFLSLHEHPEFGAADIAFGLWLQGNPLQGLYLMGKACLEDPTNINYVNNYASMLTMAGAEQMAIPILNNLNIRYPGNSTVLNNIGQAWFGLGDLDRAGRNLDSAIQIFAFHAEANYTKHLIEENRGNTKSAQDALIRSMKREYTSQKERKLRKLGGKISGADIDFPFPIPQDPLGLDKFTWPAYPLTVDECAAAEIAWEIFREKCDAEIESLNAKLVRLEANVQESTKTRIQAAMTSIEAGASTAILPPYASVAIKKLEYYVKDKDGGEAYRWKKLTDALNTVLINEVTLTEARDAEEAKVHEEYDPQIGEGKSNPLSSYCADINAVRNKYLRSINEKLKQTQENLIEHERKSINNQTYFNQYICWPEEFEVVKIKAKIRWLNTIKSQQVRYQELGEFCKAKKVDKEAIRNKMTLQEFDDVACRYHSSIEINGCVIKSDCSRLEGIFSMGPLKYSRKVNTDDNNRLIKASAEVKIGEGKSIEKGPIQVGAKAEISGTLTWDEEKITNWIISSEVAVNVGSNLGHGDKSIEIAGVKGQIGMNSGSSVTGRGLLSGIQLK